MLATPRCLDWRHDLQQTSTNNDRRIRTRRIRVAGLLVVVAAIAAALGYQLLASSSSTAASPIDVLRSEQRGALGEALPSTVWPAYGQAAVQIGQSQIQAGPNQHAAAIASVAKVMTAYVVLRDHPLQVGQDGPTITLTDADVADTDRRRRTGRVRCAHRGRGAVDRTAGAAGAAAAVGEQHRRGSGAMGRRLGGPVRRPDECHRTVAGHDPHPLHRPERLRRRNRVDCRRPGAHRRSGHAPAGVREHRRHTERDAAGRRHRAQHRHDCSGYDGFVGVKTGSDSAAGGCFAFRAIRWIDGKRTTITGVVLGQPGYDQVAAGLAAADAMVDRIAGQGAVPDSPQPIPAMPAIPTVDEHVG